MGVGVVKRRFARKVEDRHTIGGSVSPYRSRNNLGGLRKCARKNGDEWCDAMDGQVARKHEGVDEIVQIMWIFVHMEP